MKFCEAFLSSQQSSFTFERDHTYYLESKMADADVVKKMKKLIGEAFNYEAAMDARKVTQEEVDNFREILLSCESVPKAMPNKTLLLALIVCQNDIDKSVNLFKNYCLLCREAPEFFANRDMDSAEVQACLENQIYVALPPTPDNCNLLLHKLSNYDPSKYVYDDAMKTFLMTVGKNLKIKIFSQYLNKKLS